MFYIRFNSLKGRYPRWACWRLQPFSLVFRGFWDLSCAVVVCSRNQMKCLHPIRLLQAIIVVLSAVSNGKLPSEGLLLEFIVRGASVDNSHELGRTGWNFLNLLLLAFCNLRALCKCTDDSTAARCFSPGASRVRVVVLALLFLLRILN